MGNARVTGPRLMGPNDAEQEAADAAAVAAATGYPALAECWKAAALLTEYAAGNPGDQQAEDWRFEATERIVECAHAIAEGYETRVGELAREARGERAAVALGRLDHEKAVTAERIAGLDPETRRLLEWYAAPYPIEWLWAPKPGTKRVVVVFHGPGGVSVGLRNILGADVEIIGIDLDGGAVATAEAAGFRVIQADVTALDPESPGLQFVTGIVLTPPCQAFTPSGLGKGRYAAAIDIVLGAIWSAGAAAGFLPWEHSPTGYAPRSGETWDEVRAPLAELEDPRAGLMAEVVIWPLGMLARPGSTLEWVVVEQSSRLPQQIEDALFAELTQAGWHTTEAWTLDAVTYGAASHRKRRFMAAYRGAAKPFVDVAPAAPIPAPTFAQVVGWPTGHAYLTRGNRPVDETGRAKGGNKRSADLPASCVTATAYGWADAETGATINQSDIGRLVGFPADFPWRHVGRGRGVRNMAQQAADAVCPMVAAAVLARVLAVTDWEARDRRYAQELYGLPAGESATEPEQLDLFVADLEAPSAAA